MTNGSASGLAQDGWHLAASPETTASPEAEAKYHTAWQGRRAPLSRLVLWTGILTILTLGLYRFWARTRIRRWYWSAIRPGGFPMEYTGTPYEKLLGFLVAVVILAFYIGVVNLVLLFMSFSILAAPGAGYALTLLGVAPIWFFASYRAQRYLLARTRWMGIRFGLEPGAWGYALRACWHWTLTIVTFGLWHPRLRFSLAKYRHDRTWYGTQKMDQRGSVTLLYPAFVHVMIGGALTLSTIAMTWSEIGLFFTEGPMIVGESGLPPSDPYLGPRDWRVFYLSVPWMLFGLLYYSVVGRRTLIAHLHVGDVGFDPRPRVGKMAWILFSGNILRLLGSFFMIFLGIGAVFGVALATGATMDVLTDGDGTVVFEEVFGTLPEWAGVAVGALFYFAVFVVWNVLTHVFLLLPTWRHYASTLHVTGAKHVSEIAQRDRDESREAGGFAEALDVGAAI